MTIRLIEEKDLQKLLKWKNANKEAFFFKDTITFAKQEEWFDEYQKRENDFMFMITMNQKEVGCIGARFLDEGWDIYNVIIGETEYRGMGLMRRAFQEVISFILQLKIATITLKVTKNNVSGIKWHKDNGAGIVSESPDYYLMQYEET